MGLEPGPLLGQLRGTEKEMKVALLLVGDVQLVPDRRPVDIGSGNTIGTISFKRSLRGTDKV